MGPVVGEDEVEAENHGIIIIQMIEAKTLKGKTRKEEGVVIKVEAGDMVTTHNRGKQQTYNQNYQPSQGTYPYMASLPMPPQNLIQPPPYDPN